MDLDDAAAELYAAAPEEFVARRTELVKQARAAKDRPLATAVGQLRRPTRSAWVANLLAQEEPAEVAGWLELGAALVDAQRRASGPDLRRLSGERSTALARLVRLSTRLAAEAGHTVTEATRQEVIATLQAALADPEVAQLLRSARVLQPASYGGFGPMDLTMALAASQPATQQLAPASDPDPEQGPERGAGSEQAAAESGGPSSVELATQAARAAALDALAAATAELDALRATVATATAEAQRATRHADDLDDQVDRLRAQLAEAEAAARTAGDEARAVRRASQQRAAAVSTAEQAVRDARQQLDDLG